MADTPVLAWRATLRRRLAVAAAVLLLWFVAVGVRLVLLQVVWHDDITESAKGQQRRSVDLPGTRGEILDRHGRVLTYSVDAESITADPSRIGDPVHAAAALCQALRNCSPQERRTIETRFPGSGRYFAYVRRQATPEQAARVAALDLDGIGFLPESRRWYPNTELAAHVLGYVGVDNTGLDGIEATYDALISGQPGTALVHRDAHRQVFGRVGRPPTTGDSLELTIDSVLQHIVERELLAGIREVRALGGSVVMTDPSTGEILAMANYPTFNPNAFLSAAPAAWRNRAVQDLYEPGSTFKIFTAAAALEEGIVAPDDRFDVSEGTIRFGGRVISDDQRHDVLSFEDVLVVSSNVGAVLVGQRLGADRLTDYARRFGFGRVASPDFRGQSAGIVWDASALNDSALASVSMGYQVGVTPLQMAAAVGAVANGGVLIEPRIVGAVIRDGARIPVPRTVLGQPITARTAAQLTSIMEAVVARGTARRAAVPGHRVAGKTGTARKLIDGKYSRTDYNASFVGFVPARTPSFAIVVVIDTPQGGSPYGGAVAAPIFQRIADAALRHYGVPPTEHALPPVVIARRDTPQEERAEPALGTLDAAHTVVSTSGAAVADGRVPDLTGLSARDAALLLVRLGLTPRLAGEGLVVSQKPAPGTPLDTVSTAMLWLERHASDSPPSTAAP